MSTAPERPRGVRVALDASAEAGGSAVAGALAAVADDPSLSLLVVGPRELLEPSLPAPGGRVQVVDGEPAAAGEPAAVMRRSPRAGARVAARLLRDGAADAVVGLGAPAPMIAAATFAVPAARGLTRPPLLATVRTAAGPVVLLDVAGTPGEPAADALAEAGRAYATAALGVAAPRVAVLRPGEGDPAALLVRGGAADVVVSDAGTGSVVRALLAGTGGVGGPDVLLGLPGVVLVGGDGADAAAVSAALAHAAALVRAGVAPAVAGALAGLVARRQVAS